MTHKDDFSAEDWRRIRNAPWIVAIAVIAADPGGTMQTARELAALRAAVAETDAHGSPNDLIRAVADDVVADRSSDDPLPQGDLHGHDSIRDGAVEYCRSVVAALDGVAGADESEQYRAWLLDLAERVANAAKEGGFLGFGGTDVSEAERATLDDLAAALDVSR